jgi:hypothetical protein
MERGVFAAGEAFPSHQFRSIVHQGGATLGKLLITSKGGSTMMRKTATTAVSVALISFFSLEVQALPGANAQGYEATALLVSNCGKGNHRNRQGQCVNGPAAAVTPTSSGASGVVCPPGTRLGERGRSCRRID